MTFIVLCATMRAQLIGMNMLSAGWHFNMFQNYILPKEGKKNMGEIKNNKMVAWEVAGNLSKEAVKDADEKDTVAELTFTGHKVVTTGRRKMSIPILGAEVKAHVWIGNRIIVGDGDYIIVGEILDSSADSIDNKEKNSIVVNGEAFKTGAAVQFYWCSGLLWGGVYDVETGDKLIEFAKPLRHIMPDDERVQFRRFGAGMEETVTTMSDKIVEADYITDNGYDDSPAPPISV